MPKSPDNLESGYPTIPHKPFPISKILPEGFNLESPREVLVAQLIKLVECPEERAKIEITLCPQELEEFYKLLDRFEKISKPRTP